MPEQLRLTPGRTIYMGEPGTRFGAKKEPSILCTVEAITDGCGIDGEHHRIIFRPDPAYGSDAALVWFTTRATPLTVGEAVRVTGTVDYHQRNGKTSAPETLLSRCKIEKVVSTT